MCLKHKEDMAKLITFSQIPYTKRTTLYIGPICHLSLILISYKLIYKDDRTYMIKMITTKNFQKKKKKKKFILKIKWKNKLNTLHPYVSNDEQIDRCNTGISCIALQIRLHLMRVPHKQLYVCRWEHLCM